MLTAIKLILNAERAAEAIVDEAKKQADVIRLETEAKLDKVYETSNNERIAESNRRTIELLKKTREDAEYEANTILQTAQTQIKDLAERAKKNFSEAVNYILKECIQ